MPYRGIYINLDRSTERRRVLEAELARFNLTRRYQRLRAADGNEDQLISPLKNPQEIGCFLSHIRALREGLNGGQHLHIIEDDTIFASCTEATLEWAIASGALDQVDILYTDIAMPLSNDSYRMYKSLFDAAVTRKPDGAIATMTFQTLDLRDCPFVGASSYLINQKSLHKLNQLYEAELAEGLRVPVDVFLPNQAKIGAITIGCLFPFVTSMRVEDTLTSTIRQKQDVSLKFTAANLGRYSFFVGCDWKECERLLATYITQPPETDRHAQLLVKLLGFSLVME